MARRTTALCMLALSLAATAPLAAHDLGQSYIFLTIGKSSLRGRLEAAVKDLNKAVGLDFRTDNTATEDDVAKHIDAIKSYFRDRVAFADASSARALEFGEHGLSTLSFAQFVTLDFDLGDFEERPEYLDVEYSGIFDVDADHKAFLVIETFVEKGTLNNEAEFALVFDRDDRKKRLELTGGSWWRGLWLMIELGVEHIWIGIDHILFLLALLLPAVLVRRDRTGPWEPAPGFRAALLQVVKVVTLFTIAHSITLSLAALELVSLSSRVVESIIAISIAIAAVDIIYPVFRGHVAWVVLGFGLFHGFGFASVLGDLGISRGYTTLSLFGFNVGVELGQLVVVIIGFIPLYLIRNWKPYRKVLVHLGAAGLIFVSLYWFIERAFEVDLPLGAIINKILGRGA